MFMKRLLPLFACNQFRLIIPFIYKSVFSLPLFYGDISYSIKKWLRHISVVKVSHSGYTFSLSEPDFHVQ